MKVSVVHCVFSPTMLNVLGYCRWRMSYKRQTSVLLKSLDENLKYIKINAEKVVKDRKQNLEEIQNQRQKICDEIKKVRNKINAHLDGLEQLIHQDLYSAEEKVKAQIEDLLRKLAEHTENIEILQTNMSAIKEYASDLQAFLGSKMIETEIKKHEILMQSLFEDGSSQKLSLNYNIEDKLSDVLSTVTSFGSISVESSSPLVVLQTENDKQAQIITIHHASPTTTNINDINMTLKDKFGFTGVRGCSFSSTGDIFLFGYKQQRLLNYISLSSSYPLDVTCIDDKTVAVTFQFSNQIPIINILTKSIESTIKTTSYCFDICYRDGHLLYCNTGLGIQKVNLLDNCSSTLVKDETLTNWSFITTSKDKIFYTNSLHHTVTCCSLTGEKMWEYKDQSVLFVREGYL
ncbi:uncharacterized protein [Mytilus edulis]|uniref:uncharacterized protein n=1 Tax=Mytilus edulis TaxID=6550 RepID=UPI0039EF2AC9